MAPTLRAGIPIRAATIGMIVSAMALMATVLVVLSWLGTRQILLESAWRSARDAGQLVNERALRTTAPATTTLQTLARDPLMSSTNADERVARVDTLIAALGAAPLISALYIAYDNHDMLVLRPLNQASHRQRYAVPAEAAFMLQLGEGLANSGNARTTTIFYDIQGRQISQRDTPIAPFDLRRREWYQMARQYPGASIMTPPYLFRNSQQAGVSLARLADNGHAVIGMDIEASELITIMERLRITPGTEVALLDHHGDVMLYQDVGDVLTPTLLSETPNPPVMPNLSELKSGALLALQHNGHMNEIVSLQVSDRDWLGLSLPFTALGDAPMQLLLAMPTDELLYDLQRHRQRLILISILLILPFLLLGWHGGSFIARQLERLANRTRQLSQFDFRHTLAPPSILREINTLNQAIHDVGETVEAFLETSRILNSEKQIGTMLDHILAMLLSATRCQSGAVYLWQQDETKMQRLALRGSAESLPETRCYPLGGEAPNQGCFELRSRDGGLQGLLVLAQPDDPAYATPAFLAFANRLAGMLAVAIEMRQLLASQQALFDAIIQVLADAIDAKSPYTGAHCQRMPELAIMLADRMAAETEGPYAGFTLDADQRYAFRLASWLHDCGKIISPEHIVNKATKLETIYNRIHEIRLRFEVLWRDAEIDCLQAERDGTPAAQARAQRDARQAALREQFAFVADCNTGSERLSDQAVTRLRAIGEQTWLRHFDDRLGLSAEALTRLQHCQPQAPTLPTTETLLADRPEHIVPWGPRLPPVDAKDPRNTWGFDMPLPAQQQHLGELHNLTVQRGTLTEEDRFAINEHVVQTLLMLEKLPWPKALARVPDMAANHHEKMDGTGYPRRIPAGTLPLTDRILCVADVFEALTAGDRPYKNAKTLSESLGIMARMCRDGHLDKALFRYFLHSDLWQVYAHKHMQPIQIDTVDIEALTRLAGD